MDATGSPEVSKREAEVLALLGARMSNADIATKLYISVRTVENHVSSLLRKYRAADRRALAELAVQAAAGAVEPGRMTGVPTMLGTFVGRAAECDATLAALGNARLVTLHGPGGIGKTRLAVAIAGRAGPLFPAGGAFVDLVPVRDGYVAQAVAAALRVTERPRQPLEDAIAERLGGGRSLLVLDNCEQVIDSTAAFAERLLSTCSESRILATSRERLGVPGERTIHLAALPLGSDAEALFRDRAMAADPEFDADPATVSRVCEQLDGMPLAIELAAARSAALGARGVLAGLDDTLRLLAGGRGRNRRHHSLRAVLDWSFDLLDEEERLVFRRLAVFAGGFDLGAAAAVVGVNDRSVVADLLGRLVDKSLVVYQRSGNRWRMLQTVRAYAADRLHAADEWNDARQRHLAWAAITAAGLEGRLHGEWRDDFDAVADDLRVALANSPPGPDPVPHTLARALGHLTFARRFLMESLVHFQNAASRAPTPGEAACDLRDAAGCAHFIHFSGVRAIELLLAAAERASAAGDAETQAIAMARAAEVAARYPGGYPTDITRERLERLLEQARDVADPRRPTVAAALAAASVWTAAPEKLMPDRELAEAAERAARATGDPVLISASLDAVRTAATTAGRVREAHRISTERFGLLAAMDHYDPRAAAEIEDTYNMACTDAIAVGDLPAALSIAGQAQHDDLVGNHPYLSAGKMIPALVLSGQLHEALRQATRMWDAWQRAGSPAAGWTSPAVSAAALAHGLLGDDEAFRRWRDRALQIAGTGLADRYRHLTFAAFVDARVAVHRGPMPNPTVTVDHAFSGVPKGWYETYARAAAAELAVVAGLPDAAERLVAAASAAEENDWAAACLARARGRLHADTTSLESALSGWRRIGARFEEACTLRLLPRRAGDGHALLAELTAPGTD